MPSQPASIHHLIAAAVLFGLASMIGGCGSSEPQNEHAGRTTDIAQDPTGEAPALLKKWCSDCHAPPKPNSHKPQEWPNIVARMQDHRIVQGLSKIDDQDINKVITYLQSHAQP